ncbi:MAG TPA: DUF308 domain-containing protein [Thermomicrobiales bacterium]|nr:DUF308 domain-containing protein [Thermomicrobiales bacterium]
MTERAVSIAREHAPWHEGTAWWVTGIEGVILALLGLYLLLAPASAGGLIIQLIALVLLIESVVQIIAGLRDAGRATTAYTMLQAGVGATIGLLLVLRVWLVPSLDTLAARTMLGLGLLAYAIIGAAGHFLGGDSGRGSWVGPVVNAVLLIILAILLLTSAETNVADRLAILGWIALIGGVALLVIAWRAYNRPRVA